MKKQIVVDVNCQGSDFVFVLNPKTKKSLGIKDGIRCVKVTLEQKQTFGDLSNEVLLMMVRMLCVGVSVWEFDLRFRNPVTRKTLTMARTTL
jgi:hypothetical protein